MIHPSSSGDREQKEISYKQKISFEIKQLNSKNMLKYFGKRMKQI